MPKTTTQLERDLNNQIQVTRANIGTILAELKRRYSQVDGGEGKANLGDSANLVDLIVATCAESDGRDVTEYGPEWEDCVADLVDNTREGYLTR